MLFAAQMDSEIVILNQVSLKDHTVYHLYVKFKIWHKWTYLWNRLRGTENRLVVVKEEEGMGGWIGSLGLADENW